MSASSSLSDNIQLLVLLNSEINNMKTQSFMTFFSIIIMHNVHCKQLSSVCVCLFVCVCSLFFVFKYKFPTFCSLSGITSKYLDFFGSSKFSINY